MEKLIELLNEYEYSLFEDKSLATQRWDIQDWVVFEKDFCEDLDKLRDLTMNVTHLISHRFWFIKGLVDNEKIDNSKFYDKYILKWFMTLTKEEKADSIIMNLSIQDNPIEFLISILR